MIVRRALVCGVWVLLVLVGGLWTAPTASAATCWDESERPFVYDHPYVRTDGEGATPDRCEQVWRELREVQQVAVPRYVLEVRVAGMFVLFACTAVMVVLVFGRTR